MVLSYNVSMAKAELGLGSLVSTRFAHPLVHSFGAVFRSCDDNVVLAFFLRHEQANLSPLSLRLCSPVVQSRTWSMAYPVPHHCPCVLCFWHIVSVQHELICDHGGVIISHLVVFWACCVLRLLSWTSTPHRTVVSPPLYLLLCKLQIQGAVLLPIIV